MELNAKFELDLTDLVNEVCNNIEVADTVKNELQKQMDEFREGVLDGIDWSDVASEVKDHIDLYDLAGDVADRLDTSALMSDLMDEMDYSDLADRVEREMDISSRIDDEMRNYDFLTTDSAEVLLGDYNPGNRCHLGDRVTGAIDRGAAWLLAGEENTAWRNSSIGSFKDELRNFIITVMGEVQQQAKDVNPVESAVDAPLDGEVKEAYGEFIPQITLNAHQLAEMIYMNIARSFWHNNIQDIVMHRNFSAEKGKALDNWLTEGLSEQFKFAGVRDRLQTEPIISHLKTRKANIEEEEGE